jgi:hypothetical protein
MEEQHRLRKWEVYVRPSPNDDGAGETAADRQASFLYSTDDRHRGAAQEL